MQYWHGSCNNTAVDAHSTSYVHFGFINPGMTQSLYGAYRPPTDVALHGSHPTPWTLR